MIEQVVDSSRFRFHFVLGMHRSGTSAVAGLLEGMGLNVGRSVMPPNSANPLGYFENMGVVNFHDRFLEELGSKWHDPRPLGRRIRSLEPDRIAASRKELAEILSREFSDQPCLVKDPRLCRLLPLWEPFIANSNTSHVVMVRHPVAVAASLALRDGFSVEKALILWLENNLEMERESRTFKREFVSYSDLLRNPGSVCRRLQQRLELPECDIDGLIQTRLRADLCHHDEIWPSVPAKLQRWCQTVFEILHGDNPERRVLDDIFQEYDEWVGWLPDDCVLAERKLSPAAAWNPSMRDLSMQVFAGRGAGYSEEFSIRKALDSYDWQTVKVEHIEALHTDSSHKLRIDLADYPALIEVASVRIIRDADGTILYEASTAEQFRQIDHSPGVLHFSDGEKLAILAMDSDPQLYLPLLPDFEGAACTLELTFRLEPLVPAIVHRLHETRAALAAARMVSRSVDDSRIMAATEPSFEDGAVEKDGAPRDGFALVTSVPEHDRMQVNRLFQKLNPDLVYGGYIADLEFAAGADEHYDVRLKLVVHPSADSQSIREKLKGTLRAGAMTGSPNGPVAPLDRKELILFATAPNPDSDVNPDAPGADSCTLEITLKLPAGDESSFPGISQFMAAKQAMLTSEKKAAGRAREAAAQEKEAATREKEAAAREKEAAAREKEAAAREKEAAAREKAEAIREKEAAARDIPLLQRAIASAEAWQKRSWFKRAFHRWRSPLTNSNRLSFFERWKRSFHAQWNRFTNKVIPFVARQRNSFAKRYVAAREALCRFVVRLRLTRRLRKMDRDAKVLTNARLVQAEWYCAQRPEAWLRPRDAVLHYLRIGARRGWNPNPLFHTGWYLARNPDVAATKANPLVHYVKIGWREGRQPHPEFCIRDYLEANPDVRKDEKEPLAHYLCEGIRDGRKLSVPVHAGAQSDTPTPFGKDPQDFTGWPEPDVRLLAFYLPQYHRIPENDAWWGEGFTEWTNVRRAMPQLEGHHQPHVPHDDIGYYDLSDSDVMERQAAMARTFGIHGFCFYFYWFAGRRLLEMPVERLLATGKPDFPFCLCWANENWTRRWDGMDSEILIAQEHRLEDDEQFIRDVIPVFRDRRYIRAGGRPLLLIYRPLLLPDPAAVFRRWREICREEGVGEIHLAGVLGGGFEDPRPLELDSAVEFPPNSTGYRPLKMAARGLNPCFRGALLDYLDTAQNAMDRNVSDFRVFRTVMPTWDNTARRKDSGTIFVNSSPSHYYTWLRFAAEQTRHAGSDERIVFINAWNEWAEGCHLEPDAKHGYQWLNATRNALLPASSHLSAPVLVIGHDAERAGSQHVLLALLREWRVSHPFPFCLILDKSGPLRPEFEECCPTLVLSDFADPAKRNTAIEKFLIIRPRLFYSNTVVNGLLLKELHRLGVPVVTHVHELQKSIERWAPGAIFEATAEYTDHFIAVSPPVAANLRDRHHIPPAKISVVHPFIDTEHPALEPAALAHLREHLGTTPKDILVLGCGTTDWRKGPDLFVQIAAACKDEARLRFIWVGAGTPEEQAALNAEIERHGLAGRVRFLGQQSDPRRFFGGGDIFLLSSREDPFPLVALEAADAGLPVVCFADAGGIPEFVGSDCGIVVPFADTAAAGAAIQRLAWDRALRERLGSQARAKVRREHPTRVAAACIAKLLNEIARPETHVEPSPDARPLVSVIVPNYNHAAFLSKRLKSIMAQGIEDMEILILDDASTDESREVIEAFAAMHPRTRVVFNETNSGSTFKQWRKGLKMARGHFVWIAESDDSAEPGLLGALVRKLQRHPDAALAYAQSRMIDETERDLGLPLEWTADLSPTRWLSDFTVPGREEIRTALCSKNSIPNASAVVFRNFEGIGDLVDDSMRLCADWLFWTRLCKRGAVMFDARPLNRWRQRTSNARTRPPGELEWEEGARVVEECAEALRASPQKHKELLSAFRARCEVWLKAANGDS